jgi:hypothetical protein
VSYNTFYWVLFQYNTCLWLRLNRNLCRMKCVLKDKPLLWDHFKSLYLFNNLSYTNFFLWNPLPSKSICCWHMCWWSLPSKFIFCWHMCWWSLCLQSPYFVDICVDGLSAFKDHILLTNGSYVSLPSKTLHVGRFLLQ